jgi:hypothetical protein
MGSLGDGLLVMKCRVVTVVVVVLTFFLGVESVLFTAVAIVPCRVGFTNGI